MRVHGKPSTYHYGCRCNKCRRAQAEHIKAQRAKHPLMRKNDRLASKARYRALHRLKSLYPKVFADFQDAERVKLGIPPVGKVPLGRHTTKAAET